MTTAAPPAACTPAVRIQQYREWKSQSSTYGEMEEWNDAINEAGKELR
jgi:hypothetical protein